MIECFGRDRGKEDNHNDRKRDGEIDRDKRKIEKEGKSESGGKRNSVSDQEEGKGIQ